jgi:uncharacterized membrane protein
MTLSGSGAKWLVGGAVVSLCVNLFLVGLMAGHWIYGPPRFGPGGPMGGPGGSGHGMEAMINGLPEDVRPVFKQEFGAAKPQFDAARDQVRAARAKVEQAAEADPFDPAAFDQAFDELQTAMDGIQKVAHETISKILPQLPAKQRHDLVEQWSKRWDRDRK